MATSEQLRDLAKARTRNALARSAAFARMPMEDQRALFRDLYRQNYEVIAREQGNGTPAYPPIRADTAPARALADKASDMIDDRRHENRRIDQAGQLAG